MSVTATRPLHILAAVVVLGLVGLNIYRMTEVREPWLTTVLGWVLIVASCAALYWRRRWPIPVALFTLLCAGLYYPTSSFDNALPVIPFAVALYTVTVMGHLNAAVTIAVLTMFAIGYGETLVGPGEERHVDDAAFFLLTGWLFGVVAIGHAQRSRHAYLREVEQRAYAAEREKEVRARQSATEERLRIARELHDVIGHSLSLMNVQSAAALHRHAKRSGRTEDLVAALEAVRGGSKEALRELRATLGLLRQEDEVAPTAPAPGLDRLEELVARARDAGVDARITVEGEPPVARPVPPQVSLAAYRIVQESLTNIVRHADATRAKVAVQHVRGEDGNAEVRIRIEDDGRGAPEDGAGGVGPGSGAAGTGGNGLAGLAERARALGGDLTAGPAVLDGDSDGGRGRGRGFRVEARLPMGEGGGA